MKLLYTPIKSYTHTVEAVIAYAGVAARIEPVPTRPFDAAPELPATNPLATVPTLVTDDGEALFGGPVIYEFLDSLHDRAPLHPLAGPARWTALRQAWMADGLFDATVRLIVEGWEESKRPAYIERNWGKITRSLDQLERDAAGFRGLTIGQVRAVGALAFLDLKVSVLGGALAEIDATFDWRLGRPALAAWYTRHSADPMFSFRIERMP
jgi:glutathione S-transferase